MASVISESSRWPPVSGLGSTLRQDLCAISQLARREYHAEIWFVRIAGPRWSHYAGEVSDTPAEAELRLIKLNDRLGLVCRTLGELHVTQLESIVSLVNKLAAERSDQGPGPACENPSADEDAGS